MFEFEYPLAFLLLPLPFLIYFYLKPAKTRQSHSLLVPFFEELQALSQKVAYKVRGYRQWLLYLIWTLVVISLAKPQWVGEAIELPKMGRDIMLVVDLSESMLVDDMQLRGRRVDRLSVVKYAARQFIEKREGDRLGLILFADKAYVQTPLTFDRKTVESMLEDATIGLAGRRTAMGDGMGLAVKRLKNVEGNSKVMILLTDGSNNAGKLDPIQAAEYAKDLGIKVYTIGLGAPQYAVSGFFGGGIQVPNQDIDEETLKKIASMTGGKFFRAEDTASLENVYASINELEPLSRSLGSYRPAKDYYYLPLLGAFILATILMSGRILRKRIAV